MEFHNIDRRLRLLLPSAIAFLTLGASPAHADAPDIQHVRSSNQTIRDIIDEGKHASPSFRRLLVAIDETDGIVYVEPGVCYHGVRACLSLLVTSVQGFRFLRVLVDARGACTGMTRLDLIATIAHELWHALEVLSDRTLTTFERVYQFYLRESATTRAAFETDAAVVGGYRVRGELGRLRLPGCGAPVVPHNTLAVADDGATSQ